MIIKSNQKATKKQPKSNQKATKKQPKNDQKTTEKQPKNNRKLRKAQLLSKSDPIVELRFEDKQAGGGTAFLVGQTERIK